MDKTTAAVALFDSLAQLYQDKYMDVSLYHESLNQFCAALPPQAEVLDVACGPGNVTRHLLNQRPDLRLLGTDLAPNMIVLAQQNNPEARFQLLDTRNIRELGQPFDGIVCGFGLPYLSREEAVAFIADAAALLRPGGLLYLSTMEDAYTRSGLQTSSTGQQLYMYFHEATYLRQAFADNGLRLSLEQRTTPPPGQDVDLMLIGKK